MELARLDLNLLLVFHHLLREKRVSAVATALDGLQQALNVRASFDPATSERRFTLAMTDVGEMYFLPVLMDALAGAAPGVTLNVVAVTSASLKDDMASGRTDLALGLLPQLQAGFFQQSLFRQTYVCLMRENHPLASADSLTLPDFAAANHVRVIAAGTGHGRVDEALERQGLQRRIRLTVDKPLAALRAAAERLESPEGSQKGGKGRHHDPSLAHGR